MRPARSSIIKDKQGNMFMEVSGVLKRWEEYVKELYDNTRDERLKIVGELEGPPILQEEVEENLWERIS